MSQFKVGDTVRVSEFFLQISSIDKNHVSGTVNLGDGNYAMFSVPLIACEAFDPVKEAEATDADRYPAED